MPKINQEEYEVLKEIRNDGFKEIRRNSTGDIAVRIVCEKSSSHQYQTKHNDKFKFLEATGSYWSIDELIEEYESEEIEVKKDLEWLREKLEKLKKIDRKMWELYESNAGINAMETVLELAKRYVEENEK